MAQSRKAEGAQAAPSVFPRTLVTLRVVTQCATLRVNLDAERPAMHSHEEPGNDQLKTDAIPVGEAGAVRRQRCGGSIDEWVTLNHRIVRSRPGLSHSFGFSHRIGVEFQIWAQHRTLVAAGNPCCYRFSDVPRSRLAPFDRSHAPRGHAVCDAPCQSGRRAWERSAEDRCDPCGRSRSCATAAMRWVS
jgi:hypothetical protein